MLGESKGPIINVNLKKHPREIQHPITDVKMELLPKIANAFNLKTFLQKTKKNTILDASQVLGLPLTSINVSYKQQKSYITVFWKGGSYYLVEILLVQSQQ